MKIEKYSPNAEATLVLKPVAKVMKGQVHRAKCVLCVLKKGAVFSLDEAEVELPAEEIDEGLTIGESAVQLLLRTTGLHATSERLALRGKYTPWYMMPPMYMVVFFPDADECTALESRGVGVWLDTSVVKKCMVPLPVALPRLFTQMEQKEELGYDVTGELVVWTSKVEARVLAGMRPEVRLIAA